MFYITRRVLFNAAHNLYNESWSPEKNWEVFGPCSNLHGHNWELHATVKGDIDPETGFVMDLKVLSDELKVNLIDKIDHKYFNKDVDFMRGILPTTENIVREMWNIMQPLLKDKHGVDLHKLRLVETANQSVEYFGGV